MTVAARRVLVAGGGLAGLAAATTAARAGHDVVLHESGPIARPRVCGELLSAGALRALARIVDVEAWASAVRPVEVRTALVVSRTGKKALVPLPGPPSLSCTRPALERALVDAARSAGVRVVEHQSVRRIEARRGGGVLSCATSSGEIVDVDAVVGAFGKRSSLDGDVGLPRAGGAGGFGAVKTYIPGTRADLEADVELWAFPGGYVGLNPVEDGTIAVCALVHGRPTASYAALLERMQESPRLGRRLERLGSPRAPVRTLSGFGFREQGRARRLGDGFVLLTGDASAMVPPFAGDGMAAALASGCLASDALAQRDPPRWYARTHESRLSRRARTARVVHALWLVGPLGEIAVRALACAPWLAEELARAVRGD